MNSSDRLVHRVRVGATFGVALGAVYSIIAFVLYLIRGGALLDGAHAPLWAVVGTYLIGGAISGALVGILVPLSATVIGAAAVGVVAITPLALGVRLVLRGFAPWDESDTIMVTTLSLAVGGGAGALARHVLNADETRDRV